MSAFVLFTALAACNQDAATEAAESYAHAMAPLLADDDALARSQVALAAGTTSGRLSAQDIAARYDTELVPAAGALRDRAKAIEVDAALPDLAAPHALLVQSWSDRADAYLAILQAYRADDLSAFDAAAKKDLDAKAGAEQYFEDVDKILGAHGATLR
jgi:electron transfer flavoprotein alpha subunit